MPIILPTGPLLSQLWNIQFDFFSKVRKEKSSMDDQEFARSLILHLYHEVTELMDGIGGSWKTHIRDGQPLKKTQVLGEVVDITKLAWEVAQVFGVTEEEFYQAFIDKSQVVEHRRKSMEFLTMKEQPKTIIFDIDGVLSMYPEAFIDFVNDVTGSHHHISALKSPDDLWMALGMSMEDYQKLKREFWEHDGGETMEPVPCAIETVKRIKSMGFAVVAVTSRNKKDLEKTELATYRWLRQYHLDFDGVYFEQDKARFIKHHIQRPVLVIEDNQVEVSRLHEAGIPSIIVYRPYTDGGVLVDNIPGIIGQMENGNGNS